MTKYILVDWPEIQAFMDHPRYKECYMCESLDESSPMTSTYMVPEDLYLELNKPINYSKSVPYSVTDIVDDNLIDITKRDQFLAEHTTCPEDSIEYHLSHTSGIGIDVDVICKHCNRSKDITNYNCW